MTAACVLILILGSTSRADSPARGTGMGAFSGIDAQRGPEPSISGTVTENGGKQLDVRTCVGAEPGHWLQPALVKPSGSYHLVLEQSGRYEQNGSSPSLRRLIVKGNSGQKTSIAFY